MPRLRAGSNFFWKDLERCTFQLSRTEAFFRLRLLTVLLSVCFNALVSSELIRDAHCPVGEASEENGFLVDVNNVLVMPNTTKFTESCLHIFYLSGIQKSKLSTRFHAIELFPVFEFLEPIAACSEFQESVYSCIHYQLLVFRSYTFSVL